MKRILGTLVVVLLLSGYSASAATLYIDPGVTTISRGDALKISVRLDTDEAAEECINAVEGVVAFTGPITPVDISLGDSIFSMWVEPPTINEKTKEVTFAGGIPNGYCGRVDGDPRLTNNIFDIIVRAQSIMPSDGKEVVATASFTNQTVGYLNDGLGTKATMAYTPSNITVLGTMNSEVLDPWTEEIRADNQRPQPFSIQLQKDERAFGGKYYISFNTTDKQTGIDHYEIIEENLSQLFSFTWGGTNTPWREARSPYVLRDQTLNSTIRVRAIDKAGNEYVATFVPDESMRSISLNQVLSYVLAGLALIAIGGFIVYVARRKRRLKEAAQQAELDAIQQSYQTYDQ